LTEGEHLAKNRLRKKAVFAVSLVAIVLLLTGAVLYEVYQIFGYVLQ
jgi:hypothetical protein